MNPAREELLFQLALLKPADERAAWLDRECAGDRALRQRLEALLAAHEPSEGVLGEPVGRRDEFHESPTEGQGLTEFGPPMDETIGQKIGRYKILEKVGEGGCGVVYVAEQAEPVRRRVVLKVIKLGMDDIARLWNAKTGKPLRTLIGRTAAVHDVAFSPDGHLLASAGLDQTIKVCAVDLDQTGI